MLKKSRHPKIQYWFWDEEILQDKKYLKDIDNIAQNTNFDTLAMSARGTVDFWDPSYKTIFKEAVDYAHSYGLKVLLQLWPKGFINANSNVSLENAVAFVTEHEAVIENGEVVIRSVEMEARYPQYAPRLKNELLLAVAFRKCGDGFYEEGSLVDITDTAKILYHVPETLSIAFQPDGLEGYTVYCMVAHYYQYADLFSDAMQDDYKSIMDYYEDVAFDGIVLDEFKNMPIRRFTKETETFRGRFYGRCFDTYFYKTTGKSLIQTMFEMRYCPQEDEGIRISAINNYFDIFRHSTRTLEKFVAEYSVEKFGNDAFIGLHNTFHNHLQVDEIWATGCNWWEVPRKYAQTDEDITYPARMGIACTCPENIIYDMYYTSDAHKFYEKAMRDARYGCRIHYHAINDHGWGLDTGEKGLLDVINKLEDKITLLNLFEPQMPKMELLVVFGFPALCNWYPDVEARNKWDINGSLNIMERVDYLWKEGCFNALAPSDAIIDGRIQLKDGKFDYCGHTFDKLLFLYPQYSKESVMRFLRQAIAEKYDIKVLGEITKDFGGHIIDNSFLNDIRLEEEADIPACFGLKKNSISDGCELADGSVVITNLQSLMNDEFCTYQFIVKGYPCEAEFKGVFALLLDDLGEIKKIAAGNLKSLTVNGRKLINLSGDDDVFVPIRKTI